LDEYRSPQHVAAITNRILMHPRTSASLVLFASPQILGSQYRGLLLKLLVNNNMLSMVFIDEVHLMVQFGLHFRAEFLH
jgi:superfamily II DNA helicase RecQ